MAERGWLLCRAAKTALSGTLWRTKTTGMVHRTMNCPHINGEIVESIAVDGTDESSVVGAFGHRACSTCYLSAPTQRTALVPSDQRKTRTPQWDEEDERLHPRSNDGKFTRGDGSATTPSQDPQQAQPTPERPQQPQMAQDPATDTQRPPAPQQQPAAPQQPAQPQQPEVDTTSFVPHPGTTGVGSKDDPVRTSSVEDAAMALTLGLHVELEQPKQVSTLLDKLSEKIAEAKAAGGKLDIDLCNVTVEGTNLFCVESKGIPRIKMPQLKVAADRFAPDSRAVKELQPNAKGEYDLQPLFLQHLKDIGYDAEETQESAANLKATQNQLNGGKIAGMTDALLEGKSLGDEPIFVSDDDYIVDGHHRWAANVAADYADGTAGDFKMTIWRINVDIITLLKLSNDFAAEYGSPQASVTASKGSGCSSCGPTLDEMNAHARRKMAVSYESPLRGVIGDPEIIDSIPPEHRDAFVKLLEMEQRRETFGKGGKWYHASRSDLAPGTILVPGGGPATDPQFYEDQRAQDEFMGAGNRADHVWITPDREDASFWAALLDAKYVYEVEPTNPRPWGISGVDGYVCSQARVIKRVSKTGSRTAGWELAPMYPPEMDDPDYEPPENPILYRWPGLPDRPSGPLYHGSKAKLPLGTVLRPNPDPYMGTAYQYVPVVWMTTSQDEAAYWAGDEGWVYEVEPIGTCVADEAYNGKRWVARQAEIKKATPASEIPKGYWRTGSLAEKGRAEAHHRLTSLTTTAKVGDRGYLDPTSFQILQARVKVKVDAVPMPTREDIERNLRAMREDGRPGGDFRGNSYDRRRRSQRLLEEFGDGRQCGCAYCGKILDASTLTEDKIITGHLGGRYILPNLIPACQPCNARRSDSPFSFTSAARPKIKMESLPASFFPPTLVGGKYRTRTWRSWAIVDAKSDQTTGVVQGYEPDGENPDDGPFTIAWINITPSWQRKGFATAAVMWLADAYNGVEYESLTDEGAKFWPSLRGDKRVYGAKDDRFKGVSLKQDDDGWYVSTHRARSDSYPTPEDIPQSKVDFIESTGSLQAVAYQTLDGQRLDAKALGEIAVRDGFLTPEQVAGIMASNKHAYTDLEKILRGHLYSMWARGEINIGPFHEYLGPDDTWAAAEERARSSMPRAAKAIPVPDLSLV